MRPRLAAPQPPDTVPVIRPLRPLVYNFFVSERPACFGESFQEIEMDNYKSFHSHKIQTSHVFKPTMHFKKLADQPKFLLSVERKKIKIMKGISQRASPEKPSRNSYRGSKLKNNSKTVANQEDPQLQGQTRDKKIESQELVYSVSPRKQKQPHLHFNLRHLLKTRKSFNLDFDRGQNITGSNYPYYQYYSSDKSNLPKSQHSTRQKYSHISKVQTRAISTSFAVRSKPANQNFS